MRIDVHAHHFPAEYIEFLTRLGQASARNVVNSPGGKLTLDERLALMESATIDRQVLSVGAQAPYFPKAEDAVAGARMANDLYAGVCREYKGRFEAFGTIPLPHVGEAVREIGRCLGTLGMLGITVGCSVAGRPLDDPEFEPFFAELDRRRTVLLLHPVGAGATTDYGLAWMIGSPFEDTVTALRLVLSGLTTRYPNIRIIVPHLGGTLPFLLQRLDDHAERSRFAGAEYKIDGPPSAHVKRFWFDTVNEHPAALRCACESFGADRLMLGTDFPYLAGPKFKRCVTYVEDAGLGEKDVAAILDTNAKGLLGL